MVREMSRFERSKIGSRVQAAVGVLRLAIERMARSNPHGLRAVLTAKRAAESGIRPYSVLRIENRVIVRVLRSMHIDFPSH
jgi:hypothetical protein